MEVTVGIYELHSTTPGGTVISTDPFSHANFAKDTYCTAPTGTVDPCLVLLTMNAADSLWVAG